MSRQALGLIETVGLAAGIEAADAAVKAANVTLLGYELTKGGGMVTVKLAGDVGAVNAAVAAGVAAAQKVGQVYSKHIIPRPHDELGQLIESSETVGSITKMAIEEEKKSPEADPEEELKEGQEKAKDSLWDLETIRQLVGIETKKEQEDQEPTCNLCQDPVCPRQRGEAKTKCIHYQLEDKDK